MPVNHVVLVMFPSWRMLNTMQVYLSISRCYAGGWTCGSWWDPSSKQWTKLSDDLYIWNILAIACCALWLFTCSFAVWHIYEENGSEHFRLLHYRNISCARAHNLSIVPLQFPITVTGPAIMNHLSTKNLPIFLFLLYHNLIRPYQINFMFHGSDWVPFLNFKYNVNHMITVMWSNIAEEADSLWYEWLNIYKNWGAVVVKNRGMTMCG